MSRRELIKATAAGAIAAALPGIVGVADTLKRQEHIRHAACSWCYEMPLETLAAEAVRLGLGGLDLVEKKDWPILKKHGLVCTMVTTHSIEKGLNDPANHEECLAKIRQSIEDAAEAGYPNVICFSGDRKPGVTDAEGVANCITALKKVIGLAEEKGITLCMELLNSKVDHAGYMCDHTDWGVKVCKGVGSPNMKLLYDIYHMQIMEGDIIRTIHDNIDYIGHIHTGGNPGRNEIDETQEIYYPAVMQAIVDSGYKRWVAQEFVPRDRKTADVQLKSLANAIDICDV